MKAAKTLSLFFIITFLIGTGNALAQEKDSISYWYSLILSPKGGQDLIGGYLFFEKEKEKSLLENDTIKIIYNLSVLSIAEFELGAYHESENSAIQALELTEEIESNEWASDVKIGLYNSLGKVHRELDHYKKSIQSYDKVLGLTQNLNDCIIGYNNKANVYIDEDKLQLALTELSFAHEEIYRNKDKKENARVLCNLGLVQSKLGDSKGVSNMFKALEMRKLENDLSGMFSSYKYLTEYYHVKNIDSASFFGAKAYDLSMKINSPIFKMEALSNLLKLEKNSYYHAFIDLIDAMDKSKLDIDKKFSNAKYDVNKERQKSLAQKLQSDEEKKRQKLIFIGVGLLLLISAVFLFFILKLKHKKEKVKEVIKETYQTERRLSKKVHDELANDMSDTLNYVDNHEEIPTAVKTHLVDRLDELYDRTRDISAEIDGFDSKDFARSFKFLITQHNTEGVKVITNVMSGINWDTISDHKKINIYRSLQELLVNMKKHSKAKKVTVIFKSEGRRHFINYTDDGVGFVIKDVRKRGLQNVETRIKNIQGSVTFNSSKGNGFKAHLYF
ncbi:MAG: tetratricopeptide (TPR) repeat protein [Dokdonia sp.]|jgi:tetratricopeptide (TPR) repeat protein